MMDAKDKQTLRYAYQLTARFPEANRRSAERYLTLKVNGGQAANTVYLYAKAISHLQHHVGAKPYRQATAADLLAMMSRVRRTFKDSTIAGISSNVSTFLKHVRKTNNLPFRMREALQTKRPPIGSTKEPVTAAEWQALLDASLTLPRKRAKLKAQAIMWTLRYSGMRASELLALNVGSVQYEKDGAFLRMPSDAPRLKTGARRPFVIECVPVLKAWLAAHPAPGDPDAPLFTAHRPAGARLTYQGLIKLCHRLSKVAGTRTITPHLFRHARATDMARSRWQSKNATKQMGWSAGSKMWDHYNHMVDDDLIEQVTRDAAIDPAGAALRADPNKALSDAVSAAVAQTLRSLGHAAPRPDERGRPPR